MTPPDQPPSGFDPSAFDFTSSPDSLAARMAEEQQNSAANDPNLREAAANAADVAFDFATEGVGAAIDVADGAGALIEGTVEAASAGLEIGGEALGAVAEVAGGCFSGCCVLLVFLFLGASTVLAYVW